MKVLNHEMQDWSKANPDSLAYILDSAKRCLQDTVNTARVNSDRAFKLISYIMPLFYIMVGFILSSDDEYMKGVSLGLMPTTFLSLSILTYLIIPFNLYRSGDLPSKLFMEDFIDTEDYTNEQQFTALQLDQIKKLEIYISENIKENNRRSKILIASIVILIIGLMSAAFLLGIHYL